jgi:putative ABC transport system permease protein
MVALAAALVGAIVLGASTGFNVLERIREIGVIRTLGATPRAIIVLFVAEGALVAVAAALLSVAISIALTLALNEAAARTLLHVAVPLRFSMQGLAILCGGAAVVVLAVLATVAFALLRPVRETLNFE